MYKETAEGREGTRIPLHNVPIQHPREPEDTSSSGNDANNDGTWGERDMGGPVDFRAAMQDYEDMRRELTNLSRTRTAKSNKSNAQRSSGLRRITSAGSRRSRVTNTATEIELDLEALGEEKSDEEGEEDFELGDFLKDGHFEKRQEGKSAKKVGVVYKSLTVKGIGATTTFVKTLPSAIIGVRILIFIQIKFEVHFIHLLIYSSTC